MRVVPRENGSINETWISDRDRFSYEGIYHEDRITKPLIRENDVWQECDWSTALAFAARGLQSVCSTHGAEQVGALISPNATLEESYLLQKLMRQLGSNHIDHRLRQVDFSEQDASPSNIAMADIEQYDRIVLIGSNIQKEQPSAALRVRKAVHKGAQVICINMMDYAFHFAVKEKQIAAPHHFIDRLTNLLHDLNTPNDNNIVHCLKEGKKILILLGSHALNHPEACHIRALTEEIAGVTNAKIGVLTEGANARGAWIAGAIPHAGPASQPLKKAGLNAEDMLRQPRKAYLFLNAEPDLDFANPPLVLKALEQSEFIISLSLFKNPVLEQYARVILPIGSFTETSGTFINSAGEWQSFNGSAASVGESRPAWKILRVLGNYLHLDGFEYKSTHDVLHELKIYIDNASVKTPKLKPIANHSTNKNTTGLSRIGEIPLYANDSLVRRAKALQQAQAIIEGELAAIRIHPKTALKNHIHESDLIWVKQDKHKVRLAVIFDKRVAEEALYIPAAISATTALTDLFGSIEIDK